MKLYRCCSYEEIEAIKSDSDSRIYFGRPLYCYMDSLMRRGLNIYPAFEYMWDEYVETNSIQPILKTFKGIPKCIDLQTCDFAKKQEIFKLYYREETMPSIVEDMMKSKIDDFVFVMSIKVGGFFDNPVKPYRFWQDANYLYPNSQVMTIEFDEQTAAYYGGTGFYEFGAMNEYAIPMYMLKSRHIVETYEIGSKRDTQVRNEYVDQIKRLSSASKFYEGMSK